MSRTAQLASALATLGLPLDESVQRALLGHLDLIAQWGRVYNLTAVMGEQEMLTHHLLDSLTVVRPLVAHLESASSSAVPRMLDVGSGAGLPGVTLAMAVPSLLGRPVQVTCVDAVQKKVGFIRQVAAQWRLGASLQALHGRIEDLAIEPVEVITCRAFASLSDFVRLTRRHLSPGGVWMLMKGQVPESELVDLPDDVEVFHVEQLHVPGLEARRCLIWMRLTTRPADG